jgi:hypothetical protein
MLRRLLVSTSALALAAVVPATASAAAVAERLPEVKRVAPRTLNVGQVLVVSGRNFRPGTLRNQVVFARPGARPVFALAERATKYTLRVRVPAKLLTVLPRQQGKPVATRFRVSVLTDRLQPRFTRTATSPLIGPPAAGATVPGVADCDGDGVAETARQGVLGLLVVGLRLAGVQFADPNLPDPTGSPSQPGTPTPPAPPTTAPGVPSVPGVPGVPDVGLPEDQLPPESLPPAIPTPDCGPAPAG